MSEEKQEYITEALGMLGKGYEQPAIEIEQERTVVTRRGGKLTEETRAAFVKISTAFKAELPDISADALKVWIFIALSINRNNEKAYPALRTIATGVSLAVNTVQKAIKELEERNLLEVARGKMRYNIYQIPEYVSANRAEPNVSPGDTMTANVSNSGVNVSNSDQNVSPAMILNQKNQSKPDIAEKIKKSANKTVDAILENERQSVGKSWSKLPAPYDLYGKAFCEATGLNYHKTDFNFWASTFDEWMTDGFQPTDISKAVEACRGKTDISSPRSITWKLRAMMVENGPKLARQKVDPYASLYAYLDQQGAD
jgi:hypothetical protein